MSTLNLSSEHLAKLNKTVLITLVSEVAATIPVAITTIPAVPARGAVIVNGVTTVSALDAIPGKSITEQINALPEVAAYHESCLAIDAANEKARTNFETSTEYVAAKAIYDEITKFEADNKAILDQHRKLTSQYVANNNKANEKGSNVRLIRQETLKLDAQIIALEKSLTFPATYDGNPPSLPTFTPAPYPAFTSTSLITIPLSFVVSGKKSKAPATAKVSNGEKKDWNDADLSYITAQLAAGAKFSVIYNHLVSLGYSEGQAKGKINTLKK